MGRVFAPLFCRCDCPNTCRNLEVLDVTTCNCTCPSNAADTCLSSAGPRTELNATICGCQCPTSAQEQCGENQLLNPDSCECDCLLTPDMCTEVQFLNESKCMCQCNEVLTCPPGMIFDEDVCECRCQQIIPCISPLHSCI